ncbi:MAG TPA: FG-GAP-like repeat-containing protein [Bryobacteraceae bacterium]|nr:FG-GAP-like repeat-containing protein [Bryobacteraceae bacterium]
MRRLAFALVWTVALLSQTEPSLGDAFARLQAGDAAGAESLLLKIAEKKPADPRVWRMLGNARLRLTKYDGSVQAFRQALSLDPTNPQTMYNLGCVYAHMGSKEEAFSWLEKAKGAHMDMSGIDRDPDLDNLKADATRFPQLKPRPEDFANPFVESGVRVIHEWVGESADDQFGWIARNIGDVDGDGVPDFVTSAPTAAAGAGRIYVYSTKSGKLLWKTDGPANGNLGTGVEGAGDTNGDKIPDVVASAPGVGKAFVYSGRDGRLLRTLDAPVPAQQGAAEQFGRHISGAGDVNGDGFADVIVGAPGRGPGHAYIFSGKDGTLLSTLSGERDGDQFGATVAGYVHGGVTFLMAGAPAAGDRHTGRVYVYSDLKGHPKFVFDSDSTGRAYGNMFLSVPGDVDGDGIPDLYSTDFVNAAKGPSTGRAYIHSGKDGHLIHTFTGETAGEALGIGVATAGDVDRDGHADLIIGAWQYSAAAVSGGRAYLFSGKDGHLMRTITCRVPGDTFGFDTQAMGDIDGDGAIDFLITSAWSGVHGYHSGRVFLISGANPERPPVNQPSR